MADDETKNGKKKSKKKNERLSSFFKWAAIAVGGAIVGAHVSYEYRKRREQAEGTRLNPAQQAMQALFGGSPNPFDTAAPQVAVNVVPSPPMYGGYPAMTPPPPPPMPAPMLPPERPDLASMIEQETD